jgi:microcin C transport system substrate-binding protein
MRSFTFAAAPAALLAALVAAPAFAQDAAAPEPGSRPRVHAVTWFGDPPQYGPDFEHWDYVDPDAPKGGEIVLSAFGSFDSFNDYIIAGDPATGLGLLYDSLVSHNAEEGLVAFYGDVAESMEVAEDRSWAIFHLRDDVRFHDGTPVTAHDVVFSQNILRDEGAPRFQTRFYDNITAVEALDDRTVRIAGDPQQNPVVILQVATFPIFPAHWWEDRDFSESSLEPPLGSGPYRIAEFDAGRSVRYERVEDYWGEDLPLNVGQNNFDAITFQYYRDRTVQFEAFKSGEFDFFSGISARDWTEGFEDFAALSRGEVVREAVPSDEPENWRGMLMNLRRPLFEDIRVRHALNYFYDFETIQRLVHFGLYRRVDTYFPNSEMAATGLPEGRELEILEQYRERIPEHVFTEPFAVPSTQGSGSIRGNLRRARELFAEAGWEVRDGRLTDLETGEPMEFEILYLNPDLERELVPLQRNFDRGGIEVTLRPVDSAQFARRIDEFDYDLIYLGLVQFYPPFSALRGLWGSENVDQIGNENFTGIQDPVLDALIEHVVQADSFDEVVAAANALDRYVSWQWVSIPTWFDDSDRIAYWDMFGRPETLPRFGIGFPSAWWYDPSNDAALRENR